MSAPLFPILEAGGAFYLQHGALLGKIRKGLLDGGELCFFRQYHADLPPGPLPQFKGPQPACQYILLDHQ